MSTQPWQCALITGGGGGLGKVFAQSLIKRGKKVYIAGRTESSLSKTAKEIGAAGYFVVDVGDLDSLPAFAEKVFKEAPEVDCLVNNAGIQKPLNFEKGADLKTIKQEVDINVTGLVQLCALFVPHLKQKPHAAIGCFTRSAERALHEGCTGGCTDGCTDDSAWLHGRCTVRIEPAARMNLK
ncbi:hypothetical protein FRC08_002513 [Ceratobasidium sp. 394]|nr:hypothetical protein FRC08_002513 [Ceratobasidium sp. 394]